MSLQTNSVDADGLARTTDGKLYVTLGTGGAVSSQTLSSNTLSQTAPNSNVRTVLAQGGIPLIGLSSGSVAANGAISGITALPLAYPNAYCYFPANALATVKAAGWYYCTFSTTTAGVAFLDTYTSGVPMIPASPTPVTDGKGAFTGDTSEEMGHTITIPALTASSHIIVTVDYNVTNNANSKTPRVRFSGSSGTVFHTLALASVGRGGAIMSICNTGATGKQVSQYISFSGATVAVAEALGTIDTSVATSIVLSIQRATATDNVVILPPMVELVY